MAKIPDLKPQPGVQYITLESVKQSFNAVTSTFEAPGTELGNFIKKGMDEYKAFDRKTKTRHLDLMFDDQIDARDREVMSVLGNLPNRLHHMNIPSSKLLQAKAAYYEEKKREGGGKLSSEDEKMAHHVAAISQFASTACIMPVWNVQTDMLNYTVMYSNNLDDKFAHLSEEDHNRAYIFTQFHEVLGHLLGHDFPAMDDTTLSRRRHLETALTGAERNIVQDLRINSFGVRYLGKTGRVFQNAFPGGVYGETTKLHMGHIPAAVETLHQFAHGQIKEENLPDEIDKNIARWTGQDIPKGTGENLLASLDLGKTVTDLKGVRSLDDMLKAHKEPLEESLNTKEFGYTNFLDKFADVYKDYQDGGKVLPDYQTLGEVLADVKDHLKFKPSKKKVIVPGGEGDNPFEGESVEIPDEYFQRTDIPGGKSSSQEREAGEQVGKAASKVTKSQPGRGSHSQKEQLADVENAVLTDAIQSELRRFGNLFSSMPVVEFKHEDIVPSEMVPVLTKYREHLEATRGYVGPQALPMGVYIPQVEETPLNGVILGLVDESGSMSNEAVAAAKTALTKVCSTHNLAVIGISMAGSHEDLSFSSYFPRSEDKADKKDFMQRFQSGGTGDFHKPLYDFDEVIKNEGLKTKLQDALPKEFPVEELGKLWNQKKVGMIVVTDGDIGTDHPNAATRSKWDNYAKGYKEATQQDEPPLAFISVTNRMTPPIENGENLVKTRKLNTKTLSR